MQTPADDSTATVIDRADLPRSFLDTAWPLLALALILLLLLRACAPAAPTPAPPPVFDAAAAAAQANTQALQSLRALPAAPAAAAVLAAVDGAAISFASGSLEVPADAGRLLEQLAKAIAALPAGTRIVVSGHGDGGTDAAAEQALAQRRAEAVRAALIAFGAPAAALLAGSGADSDAGGAANRRVAFGAR
jgi:OOP family OmpA-OmpF porin